MTTTSPGPLTSYLLSAGWQRNEFADGYCGEVSEDPNGTGECYHIGKWTRYDVAGTLCAQHARIATRIRVQHRHGWGF